LERVRIFKDEINAGPPVLCGAEVNEGYLVFSGARVPPANAKRKKRAPWIDTGTFGCICLASFQLVI